MIHENADATKYVINVQLLISLIYNKISVIKMVEELYL